MSEDRPSRRRIAGESASSASRPAAKGPRVVRKPVRRPGAPTSRSGAEEATSPVTEATDETTVAEPVDVREEATSQESAAEATREDEGPAAARVVPAVRRPRRRQRSQVSADAADPGESTTDPGRARRAVLVLAAVVALAFAGAAGYWAYGQVQGSTGVAAAQNAAESAATEAAQEILSYRYDQLDEHLEKSQALMTPDFAEEFETISPALNDLAPQRQIVVEATAREAAPMPCGDDCSTDETEVLVFVDQARVADGEQQPTVFGNRITMSMVRDGDDWLVDDIEAY